MIKLFRRIRQRLLSENKFSKYLLYAMGEILLVVIGILIALQINNWNEERKNNQIEKELLESLRVEFLENNKRLTETIRLQSEVVSYSRQLLILFENDELLTKKDSIAEFVSFGALAWWRAEPVTGTFDAMVNTGSISLIQNKNLRRFLTQFDAEIKSGFEDHQHSMDLLNELTIEQSESLFILSLERDRNIIGLPPTINSRIEEEKLIDKIAELKKNRKFFGLLSSKIGLDISRLERQKKLKLFNEEILAILENELNK